VLDQTVSAEPTQINGVDITAYLVRDPAGAIAFYRDVLGMTPTAVDDGGRGAEFTLADGSTFGVWSLDDGATGATTMFAVADVAAAVERIRLRGAEISDPVETPACFMAMGRDPEGNGYIIHHRKTTD